MNKLHYATSIGLLFFTVLFTSESYAQGFQKLDEVPHDISYYRETRVTPPLVKILYGRPSKNNQEVFGNLIPFGKVWRTGYNEATEVQFYEDVVFGNKTITAGTYVLLTIPHENEWEIILSTKLDVLGAFQYDPSYNVAKIIAPVSKAESLESFSISFKRKDETIQMVLGWDATRVKIPLKFNKK